MIESAIVVIAYNREKPLRRLLKSLADASYPSSNITLHISIDASTNTNVKTIADEFIWPHGKKIVDLKEENLGLLKHVLSCGELTEKYESIIVLEDDLLVAPGFYRYAQHSNAFYAEDEKVAGVSLFTYPVEEHNFYPFQPIQDESDVHFIQVASSWGQSWTNVQWSKFMAWLNENPQGKESLLPDYIIHWGANSWKKRFINYMIDTDRYFVFPNSSYSTNFEEIGTHSTQTGLFQVSMNLGVSEPRLKKWVDSNSVYDVYFELIPSAVKRLVPQFSEYDLEVDLYGMKPLKSINSEYVLTSRRGADPVKSFGSIMTPLFQNVMTTIEGDQIGLYRKENLLPTERNRFLALYSSPITVEHYSDLRKQNFEHVSIVIPVLNHQLEDLTLTVKSMISDRFYTTSITLVCSQEIQESVSKLAAKAPVFSEVLAFESENVDDLLREGISNCKSDFCSWMQPGMIIDLQKMEEVSKIFLGMSQVHVLYGLESAVNENNYVRLNTASKRWTPQRANSNKIEAGKVRTEFIFWRTTLVSNDLISKLTSAHLFLELLKRSPIYLVALKLGDFNGKSALSTLSENDVKQCLVASEFQPRRGFKSILRPVFQYWFRRNVPFFRLFYKETEQLPMVIRYDFENDSYFLDNY